MTTEHYLWAIFALLFLALVLVVITARRGPWQKPVESQRNKGAGVLWIPLELTESHDEFTADVCSKLTALIDCTRLDAPVPEVRLMASGVDPLWGKNRPEGS